jgi:hypothetical protein
MHSWFIVVLLLLFLLVTMVVICLSTSLLSPSIFLSTGSPIYRSLHSYCALAHPLETTVRFSAQSNIKYIHVYPTRYQANYINALAVSVLPLFEPAKPITLGEPFVTLGELFLHWVNHFLFFFVYLQCNVRWRILLMLDQISTVLARKNDELSLVLKLNRCACILRRRTADSQSYIG